MSQTAAYGSIHVIVREAPKGGRDTSGKPILKARIATAPEDGNADFSLMCSLSKEFDVPKSAVTILRGADARVKQVQIEGDGAKLAARLKTIGGPA